MLTALGFAAIVGFLLSIPVGPVSSIVIRRTVARGFAAGLAAGAGVALADAIFGALGIVGATLPFVVALASGPARILAGLALVALGVLLIRTPIRIETESASGLRERAAGFAGTFAVAIVNPGAIPIVAAAFASARVTALAPSAYPAALGALFGGAMVWWAALCGIVVAVRGRLGPRSLRALNVATGGIAIAGGLAAIAETIFTLRH